jgi:hypothetical protein
MIPRVELTPAAAEWCGGCGRSKGR